MAKKVMRVVLEVEVEDFTPAKFCAPELEINPNFDAEKYFAEALKSGVYMGMIADSTAMELAAPLNDISDYKEFMREIFAGSNLFVKYNSAKVVSAEYAEEE